MNDFNEFGYKIDFKHRDFQENEGPFSISIKETEKIQNDLSYKTLNDAYCYLILDRLRIFNKFQRKDFINYQISKSKNPKEWFYELQSLIANAIQENPGYLNIWPSSLKGIENLMDEIYLIHFNDIRLNDTKVTGIKTGNLKEKKNRKAESFYYKGFDTDPDNLNNVCDSLKLNGFIDKSTTVPQFKRLFSGKEVNNPVMWTGTPSDLYYFITQIHNKQKLVNDMKQKQWKVACQCFIKPDGSQFEYKVIRVLKRPASTGDKLDKTIQLLL